MKFEQRLVCRLAKELRRCSTAEILQLCDEHFIRRVKTNPMFSAFKLTWTQQYSAKLGTSYTACKHNVPLLNENK